MAASLNAAAAIEGRCIALSVSDSPHLAELGLVPVHLQLALAEIARTVFVGGARLLYGGDLRTGGHTDLLIHELGRYARLRSSLVVGMASPVARRSTVEALAAVDRRLGLRGQLQLFDDAGQALGDWRAAKWALDAMPEPDAAAKEAAYAAMRQAMCRQVQARIVIGGQRRGPDVLSGVLEETLLSLQAAHAVFIVGGFGGTALDIACALDRRCVALRPPLGPPQASGRTGDELLRLAQRAQSAGGWQLLRNGLGDDENLRLAATHRPSEIAALVATGLGRLGAS